MHLSFLQFTASVYRISWFVSMNRNNIEKTLLGKEVGSYVKCIVIFKGKAVNIASSSSYM